MKHLQKNSGLKLNNTDSISGSACVDVRSYLQSSSSSNTQITSLSLSHLDLRPVAARHWPPVMSSLLKSESLCMETEWSILPEECPCSQSRTFRGQEVKSYNTKFPTVWNVLLMTSAVTGGEGKGERERGRGRRCLQTSSLL